MTPAWHRYVRRAHPMAACRLSVVTDLYHVTDRPSQREGRYTNATVLGRGPTKREAWKAAALSVRARGRVAA